MPNQEILDLKEQIKTAIRHNSDHGFVPIICALPSPPCHVGVINEIEAKARKVI